MSFEELWTAPAVSSEFLGARLGDARRTRRLAQTAQACSEAPQTSLPRSLDSKTALESSYLLFSHRSVTSEGLLQPHHDQTRERCARESTVLVVHDTTECVYSTHREGLGHLRTVNDHGFLLHLSLALTADGNRRPLGVLAAHFWTRSLEGSDDKKSKGKKKTGAVEKESTRWARQALACDGQLDTQAQAIHLMDREGDSYELFAELTSRGSRFIIRNRVNRIARSDDEGPSEHVRTLCERADVVFESDIPISRRQPKDMPARGKSLAPREARTAKLSAKAAAIQLRKPPYLDGPPMWLDINVVHVCEIDAAEGVEPVEWVLLTTEPIETHDDVIAIVEHYRARWVIEEFFKALKTGCKVEKLQLETYASLKNAVAMYLVLAWRMLLIRALARRQPDAPAEVALSPSEIEVLRLMQPDARLPLHPTVHQAFVAIAMMGGYIKHGVPPGWLTLASGFEKLILLETGWSARAAQIRRRDGRDH